MADIQAFKSSAGEVFIGFNERSHSYKLFLNILKSAETSADTAIKNTAIDTQKAIQEAKVENHAKGVVAQNSGSDGGMAHNALTNISNKLDLLFNSLSGLKTTTAQPVEYKFDVETLDVFGKKLEESLGTLLNNKLSAIPVGALEPLTLPKDFTDKIIATVAAQQPIDLKNLQGLVAQMQQAVVDIQKQHASASILADVNAKLADLCTMMKAQGSLATTAQTQQILSVSHVETTEVPVVTEAKAPISPAKAEPAPAVTIEGASPTAVACADNIMRYAAKNKKTKPNCYGKYLAGDVNTTPCLSCAWTNECQQEGKKNSKGDKPQDDKPTCFGKHKGDLDCSMCQFDSECASKS